MFVYTVIVEAGVPLGAAVLDIELAPLPLPGTSYRMTEQTTFPLNMRQCVLKYLTICKTSLAIFETFTHIYTHLYTHTVVMCVVIGTRFLVSRNLIQVKYKVGTRFRDWLTPRIYL